MEYLACDDPLCLVGLSAAVEKLFVYHAEKQTYGGINCTPMTAIGIGDLI